MVLGVRGEEMNGCWLNTSMILYLIFSPWKPCGVFYCIGFTDKECRFREVK